MSEATQTNDPIQEAAQRQAEAFARQERELQSQSNLAASRLLQNHGFSLEEIQSENLPHPGGYPQAQEGPEFQATEPLAGMAQQAQDIQPETQQPADPESFAKIRDAIVERSGLDPTVVEAGLTGRDMTSQAVLTSRGLDPAALAAAHNHGTDPIEMINEAFPAAAPAQDPTPEKRASEEAEGGPDQDKTPRRFRLDARTRKEIAARQREIDERSRENAGLKQQLAEYRQLIEKAKENPHEIAEGLLDKEPEFHMPPEEVHQPSEQSVSYLKSSLGEGGEQLVGQLTETWPELITAMDGLSDPAAALELVKYARDKQPEAYEDMVDMDPRSLHNVLLRAEIEVDIKRTLPAQPAAKGLPPKEAQVKPEAAPPASPPMGPGNNLPAATPPPHGERAVVPAVPLNNALAGTSSFRAPFHLRKQQQGVA